MDPAVRSRRIWVTRPQGREAAAGTLLRPAARPPPAHPSRPPPRAQQAREGADGQEQALWAGGPRAEPAHSIARFSGVPEAAGGLPKSVSHVRFVPQNDRRPPVHAGGHRPCTVLGTWGGDTAAAMARATPTSWLSWLGPLPSEVATAPAPGTACSLSRFPGGGLGGWPRGRSSGLLPPAVHAQGQPPEHAPSAAARAGRQDAGPALVSSTRRSPRMPSLKGAEGGGSLPGDAAARTGHGGCRRKPQNQTIPLGSDVW